MIFFVQVAGNSMQIFASEVFPTNARASGFGWAAGRRTAGDRFHHADDPVGAERLGSDDGVRLPCDPSDDRRRLGDAAGARGAAKRSRRDRTANRLTGWRAKDYGARSGITPAGPRRVKSVLAIELTVLQMNAAASAKNVALSVARATRAAGLMACRLSCTRVMPLSGTCSATAIRSSMCATRSGRRRWLSSRRRKTPGHTICKSTATSCWPSTGRISGRCSNMRPSKITMPNR